MPSSQLPQAGEEGLKWWTDRDSLWSFLLSNTWLALDYNKGHSGKIPCLSVTIRFVLRHEVCPKKILAQLKIVLWLIWGQIRDKLKKI